MNWGSGQKLRLNEARSNTLEKKVQKNKGLDKLYNSLRGVARVRCQKSGEEWRKILIRFSFSLEWFFFLMGCNVKGRNGKDDHRRASQQQSYSH